MKYTVLIVDDYRMVRQMIEMLIMSSDRYEISGQASSPEEAVAMCRNQPDKLRQLDHTHGVACLSARLLFRRTIFAVAQLCFSWC